MKLKNKKTNKWKITKEFIIKEYVKNKKSLPQLAKQLGMPYETLFWYKKKFKIPSHPRSLMLSGKRNSPKSEFKKGQQPWNTNKKGVQTAWNKGKKLSAEHKRKVSVSTRKAMKNPEVILKVQKTQFSKGLNPWNKDKTNVYSRETIENIRTARLKQIFPKKSTAPEVVLFNILNELNVKYKKHSPIKNICQADAFIAPNLVIFADGDYWHCNPASYKIPKTPAQKKNLERDKKANERLVKEGYQVLRLWENDLLKNKLQCKDKIIKFLIGEIKNELTLRKEIIFYKIRGW